MSSVNAPHFSARPPYPPMCEIQPTRPAGSTDPVTSYPLGRVRVPVSGVSTGKPTSRSAVETGAR